MAEFTITLFYELSALFGLSFGAATFVPLQSEPYLLWLLYSARYSPELLLVVASTGNILGACVNWALGAYITRFKHKKWFPADSKSLDKAQRFYTKYGVWSLLLAWVPFIGDPLTIIAGVFRTNIYVFIALVSIGKTARYAVLLYSFA